MFKKSSYDWNIVAWAHSTPNQGGKTAANREEERRTCDVSRPCKKLQEKGHYNWI